MVLSFSLPTDISLHATILVLCIHFRTMHFMDYTYFSCCSGIIVAPIHIPLYKVHLEQKTRPDAEIHPRLYTCRRSFRCTQLNVDVHTQMRACRRTHEDARTKTNAWHTASSVWADATSRCVRTLDVCSRTFRMYYRMALQT